MGRGRWSVATDEFDALERLGRADSALVLRALAATLPFLSVPRQDLQTVRSAVERWDPLRVDEGAAVGALLAMRPHLRLYVLGLLSSRLREPEAALRYAGDLEALPGPSSARALVGDLARTIRADVAWQGRRLREALEHSSRSVERCRSS